MATWKKVLLSGSAAAFSTVTIDSALGLASGGSGQTTYTDGDILYYSSSAATNNELTKLAIGATGQVLKVDSDGFPHWGSDDQGGVTALTSTNTSTLTVSGTTTKTLTAVTTGGVGENNANLITGDQAYDYYNTNFTNNAGTITSITAGTTSKNGLSLSGGTITSTGTISLTGTLGSILNSQLSSAGEITIGSDTKTLGQSFTTLNGLTGISFDSGDRSLANGVGANTLTIGDDTSTVVIPGNFRVEGTASFTDAETLQVEDKVILLNSGSVSAAAGGFIVQQGTADQGEFFGYDNTNGGRWGFKAAQSDGSTPSIDHYATIIQRGNYSGNTPGQSDPVYGGSQGYGNIAIDNSVSNQADAVYMYV